MFQIEITEDSATPALAALQSALGNMQPAMDLIGQALIEQTRSNINFGEDWAGNKFAENSPTTLAKKSGSAPLIDTRMLITNRLHHEAGADYVEIGSSAIQSAVLQFGAKKGAFGTARNGSPIPWGDIPARPFFPITGGGGLEPAAEDLILDVIREYLSDVV